MIYISNELSHHGVKGMKWGIRKKKYSKEQISQRRKELVAQAPKSNGKLGGSVSKTPTKGYWKNASDAQIRRLMESEAKEKRKDLKKDYKRFDKELRERQNRQYKSYIDSEKDAWKKTKTAIKEDKQRVKSGEITKSEHKENIKAYRRARNDFTNSQEIQMAVAQYYVQKVRRANKVTYLEAVKGKNSKAYQRGLKAFNNKTDYWGNYTITRHGDGRYSVTRTDVYVY